MIKEELHFTVEGSFINDFAKEKLIYDNDVTAAFKLIESCLVSDEINEDERRGLVLKVLDGQLNLEGDSYNGIIVTETGISGILVDHLNKMKEEIKSLKEELQEEYRKHAEQLEIINELLPEWELSRINEAWIRTKGPSIEKPIFTLTDSYKEYVKTTNKKLSESILKSEEQEESKFFKKVNIIRPHSDEYYMYGWLEPNGTFHEVKWGDHNDFAWRYLREHKLPCKRDFSRAGDALTDRGWILLHNPSMDLAYVTRNETIPLTKAQRDYLYAYYIDRDARNTAEKYLGDS